MLHLHACELLHNLHHYGTALLPIYTELSNSEDSALDGGHGHFSYQGFDLQLTGRGNQLISKVHQQSHTMYVESTHNI